MIGVLARNEEFPAVEEFFQLFKTPWERFREGRRYDVLLITERDVALPPARLVFLFGSGRDRFDERHGVTVDPSDEEKVLLHSGSRFPVKRGLSIFSGCERPVLLTEGENLVAGYLITTGENIVVRAGFNLFEEVGRMIEKGQEIQHAGLPTLDIMADLIRKWILRSGLGLVEIPPVPSGYDFTVCLTHDVDFMRIRDHLFDRTFLGFLLRSLFPWVFPGYGNKVTLRRYMKNLGTVARVPLVHMGLVKDPWYNLERYSELEGGQASTFFFLPWGKVEGDQRPDTPGRAPATRGAKYHLRHYGTDLSRLLDRGKEIGLHGIDAWASREKGSAEKKAVESVTRTMVRGIRMHWLYFNSSSPAVLEEAGFGYDSTVGYNETAGFRPGTSQVYRLPGATAILELPMIIQDSSLFYPGRMGLDEDAAYSLCREIIEMISRYGGVLTVNWHQRSLSPERNWDSFYELLLEHLRSKEVWFAGGSQAVDWFRKRREVSFTVAEGKDRDRILLVPGDQPSPGSALTPPLTVRTFPVNAGQGPGAQVEAGVICHTDIPWSGDSRLEVPV